MPYRPPPLLAGTEGKARGASWPSRARAAPPHRCQRPLPGRPSSACGERAAGGTWADCCRRRQWGSC